MVNFSRCVRNNYHHLAATRGFLTNLRVFVPLCLKGFLPQRHRDKNLQVVYFASPCSKAKRTNSVRLLVPVLLNKRLTYFSTLRTLVSKRRAISLFINPSATKFKT